MATYTLTLKEAIRLTGGTVDLTSMSFNGTDMGYINKLTGGDIGVKHFAIFDEGYRDILTGKIVDKFWNREIGFETIDLFKMKMRVTLNEVMPFYNQLYKSTLIEYEALSTIDLRTVNHAESTGTESTDGNVESSSDTTSGGRVVNSTTPQTMLSGNEDYASSASDSNSQSTGTSNTASDTTSSSQGESDSDSVVTGYQGTPADLIMRFRDSLINIDVMILRDLEPMFMQTFDNADSHTERGFGYGYY